MFAWVLFSGTSSQTLNLDNFATTRRRSSQRVVNEARQKQMAGVINWSVGLILATVDGQFITLSVHLCVEHGAREADWVQPRS